MLKNYLGIFLVLLSTCVIAQVKSKKINGDYRNKSIVEIFDSFEKESGIDIYYKAEDIPSDQRTISFKDIYLEKAIGQLLEGFPLVAQWYRDYAVVIMNTNGVDRTKLVEYYEDLQKINEAKPTFETNVITIGEFANLKSSKATITGEVLDATTQESIIGATILFDKNQGAVTDVDGKFSISIRPGNYNIKISYIGYQEHSATLNIKSDGQYNIKLDKAAVNLEEVTVTAIARDASVNETQTGLARIDIKSLEKLPTFLGEKDIVRAVLLNPGVSTIGEGATGFNVRGGNVDQNLVMQDEAILFNSSHALGFFSTFNADLIKDATLAKGTIPAANGGRIASSLEVNLIEGNKEKIRYKGSINPVSANVVIDGPVSKHGLLAFGARTTFSNYIFGLFSDVNIKNSKASFYDVNLKYTYKKNGNSIGIGLYTSDDEFIYGRQFGFNYSTSFAQVKWQKILSGKTTNELSVVASKYNSNQLDLKRSFESQLGSGIDYVRFVDKVSYIFKKGRYDFGINSILYSTSPGELSPYGEKSFVIPKRLANEKGLETALFASGERKLTDFIELIAGIRVNHFSAIGDKEVFIYKDNIPNLKNIIGKETKSGFYKSYIIPEPRASLKINFSSSASFKAGYARTSQFINQVFNSDTPTPTSQWQLSNSYIKPYISSNYSLGVFKNFDNNNYETSVEVYQRNIHRLYDFKDFASLIVNPHIETELLEGKGLSKGIEVSIKKNEGKLNGWLSYTYSQTIQKIDGINKGEWYRSGYDKPHNMSFIFNYQPILRNTFTFNFTYSTGRPSTAPFSNYITPENVYVPVYSARNELRIPDYHRLDLSYNIAKSHNNAAKFITSWTFTLYNVYGRKNPFSVFYTRGINDTPLANRLAVIGTVFPAVRFNLEFK